MTAATADPVSGQRGFLSSLYRRQLDSYPNTGPRVFFLALTVLATIMLYYELYVGGSVSTLILTNLHMTFTFYVVTLAFGNLIGAFGSLFAGLTDRYGRANLVVFGLLFTGIFVAFILPAATNKWVFTIEGFVVGIVEGICLVATPALIRDFSPQVGRATAMGFWTSGPVLGSLIVAVVGTNTVPDVVNSHPVLDARVSHLRHTPGIVVFVIALFGLRELSPQLRDQLMVTMQDRALIEMRAKGLDIEAALKNPWRQLLKPDILISAVAVSIMLLIYYTAVGLSVIYLSTVFGVSLKNAERPGELELGLQRHRRHPDRGDLGPVPGAQAVHGDRRRPGRGHGRVLPGAGRQAPRLLHAGDHAGAAGLRTRRRLHPVDGELHRDRRGPQPGPHRDRPGDLGLDHPGRGLPGVPARPGRDQLGHAAGQLRRHGRGPTRRSTRRWCGPDRTAKIVADATKYSAPLGFAAANPTVVANAQKYAVQLGNAQKFAPELAVIQNNAALFTQAAKFPPGKVPAALAAKLVKAAGGGSKGLAVLGTIQANQAAINGVIAVGPQLQALAPYATQLVALSKVPAPVIQEVSAPGVGAELAALQKVPPSVDKYMAAHAADVDRRGRQDRRPVEDLVLDLLRRDRVLPAEHSAAARPLAPARRQGGRGRPRGRDAGRAGEAAGAAESVTRPDR